MERRQAHRLYTNVPMECRAVLQDQAGTFATQAVMKNISRGGAYLECDIQPQLFRGEIGHFTFITGQPTGVGSRFGCQGQGPPARPPTCKPGLLRPGGGVPFRPLDCLPGMMFIS